MIVYFAYVLHSEVYPMRIERIYMNSVVSSLPRLSRRPCGIHMVGQKCKASSLPYVPVLRQSSQTLNGHHKCLMDLADALWMPQLSPPFDICIEITDLLSPFVNFNIFYSFILKFVFQIT